MRRISSVLAMLCAFVAFSISFPAQAARPLQAVEFTGFDRHAPQTGAGDFRGGEHARPAQEARSMHRRKERRKKQQQQKNEAKTYQQRIASAGVRTGMASGSGLVAEARRYIGGNPTGRSSLWCADFMNLVLARSGLKGTGSRLAASFASYGRRVAGPVVGAIAVMSRGKRGGHVGVVSGVDRNGNPIIVSGNHNRRVAEATYSRSRVYAYVVP